MPINDTEYFILEPSAGGHRFLYVAYIAESPELQQATLVTSRSAHHSPEYQQFLAGRGKVRVEETAASIGQALHRLIVRQSAASQARVIVIPSGDSIILLACLLTATFWYKKTRVRVLIMRTDPPFQDGKLVPRRLFKITAVQLARLLPLVDVFFLTDAFFVAKSRPWFPGVGAVPDPIDQVADSQKKPLAPLESGRKIRVGVLGRIDERKNYRLLVELVASNEQISLVLAGQLTDAERGYLERNPDARSVVASGRVVVRDSFLSDAELFSELKALDIVALLYENDSPSGFLGHAVAYRVPIIAAAGGWLEEVVAQLGVGVSCELNNQCVLEAIQELARSYTTYQTACQESANRLGSLEFAQGILDRESAQKDRRASHDDHRHCGGLKTMRTGIIFRVLTAVQRTVQKRFRYDVVRYFPASQRRQVNVDYSGINTIIDVGANRGQFGKEVRAAGFTGFIISLEPLGSVYPELLAASATDPRWTCLNIAASDTNTQATINVAENTASSSFLSINKRHVTAAPRAHVVATEVVATQRLDDTPEILEVDGPYYLKIDVQGFEKSVISGAQTLLEKISVVEIELSVRPLYDQSPSIADTLLLMRESGFELERLESGFKDPQTGEVLQFDGIFTRRI